MKKEDLNIIEMTESELRQLIAQALLPEHDTDRATKPKRLSATEKVEGTLWTYGRRSERV